MDDRHRCRCPDRLRPQANGRAQHPAVTTAEQRNQFQTLVEDTVGSIESGLFLPHSGIRFPQNPCTTVRLLGSVWSSAIWSKLRWCASREWILVCLMNLATRNPPMPPELNRRRAEAVLSRIDAILAWEQQHENERDTRFVEFGNCLCEVRAGQYWRLEKLKSFDEYLERRFPESRRKAYYLMSIHEHLPPQVRKDLKEIGWTKGRELAKLARKQGQQFKSAPWVHKADSCREQEFCREIEKALTGKDSEPSESIYFKVYKSQVPIIEQAIETAALMLGSDKSRGYCLEMICADFLAGANMDGSDPEVLLRSISRYYLFLPAPQRRTFLGRSESAGVMTGNLRRRTRVRLSQESHRELHQQVLRRDGWRCQLCGSMRSLEVHHLIFRSRCGDDSEKLDHLMCRVPCTSSSAMTSR